MTKLEKLFIDWAKAESKMNSAQEGIKAEIESLIDAEVHVDCLAQDGLGICIGDSIHHVSLATLIKKMKENGSITKEDVNNDEGF